MAIKNEVKHDDHQSESIRASGYMSDKSQSWIVSRFLYLYINEIMLQNDVNGMKKMSQFLIEEW